MPIVNINTSEVSMKFAVVASEINLALLRGVLLLESSPPTLGSPLGLGRILADLSLFATVQEG